MSELQTSQFSWLHLAGAIFAVSRCFNVIWDVISVISCIHMYTSDLYLIYISDLPRQVQKPDVKMLLDENLDDQIKKKHVGWWNPHVFIVRSPWSPLFSLIKSAARLDVTDATRRHPKKLPRILTVEPAAVAQGGSHVMAMLLLYIVAIYDIYIYIHIYICTVYIIHIIYIYIWYIYDIYDMASYGCMVDVFNQLHTIFPRTEEPLWHQHKPSTVGWSSQLDTRLAIDSSSSHKGVRPTMGMTWDDSLDWFKGKFTGNHGFYHQI